MSKAKFAKGPWVVKDGVVVCTNRSDSYTRVAYAYSGHAIPYTKEVLNNAHLIAAAPEMYEFLESLQLDVTNDYKRDEILAKARGEQND